MPQIELAFADGERIVAAFGICSTPAAPVTSAMARNKPIAL
ncbi:hypothetical protein LG3211_1521 [Lysobacter gummosus]|nr:hypothetical protein LG3211_1521 [Lysobacter gummosus]